jgi:hypothetical protein
MIRVLTLTVLAALALAAPAAADDDDGPPRGDRATLRQYAADTWRSFEAMVHPATALPADNVADDRTRSDYTSPTNIGTYLWSTIAARDLGLIDRREATARMQATLATVARLERHEASGQFYNWYDPRTGDKLTVWPADGSTVYPFLSSVDNGWLGAALLMVARAEPKLREQASAIERGIGTSTTTPTRACCAAAPGRSSPTSAACTTRPRTSTSPVTTTAPSTPSRASPPTSASPTACCRRSTTSPCGARSRPAATGAGRRCSPWA